MYLKSRSCDLHFLAGLAVTVLFSLGSGAAAKAGDLSAAEKECVRKGTLEILQRDEIRNQVKEIKKDWAAGVCASGRLTENDTFSMKQDLATRVSAYIYPEILNRCLALSGNPMLTMTDHQSYAQRQSIIMSEILKAFPPTCR